MIVNIVDRRTNCYNSHITAVIEPTYRDNRRNGASQHYNDVKTDTEYEMFEVPMAQAMEFGNNLDGSFTMFIYDPQSWKEF